MTAATFDDALTGHAAQRPDATAMFDVATRLSYRDVDDRTTAIAARFAAAGIGAGDRVVLIADNGVHHLVVAFALWRLGATLVTIYPSSTQPELNYAIDHAQAALVVSGSRVVPSVRPVTVDLRVPLVELSDSGALCGLPEDTDPVGGAIDPNALALICFTSGSTARPKAVMHSHSGLLAAARAYARVWRLRDADIALVALPLAWAFGLVTTSMATLTAGGQVVLLQRSDPGDMLRTCVEHRVTFFTGVTTMFAKMLALLDADASMARPTDLRLCVSGGEPRNDVAFARWQTLTGCPVHDVYAASECFPLVTYDPAQDPQPKAGSAGRVVPDAEMRVVDGAGHDVEPGQPGEAWARGPALMSGYWRDPELTAAVLTTDGWYRTGDLVHVDANGYVHVVGRLTDLIIRGGANVSPAEVEAALVGHPDVREVTVVGLPDPEYGQQVVAAVVLEQSAKADVTRLRAHCAATLAGYKVPTSFVAMAQLPRNPNTGKVQRREVAALLADLISTPPGCAP